MQQVEIYGQFEVLHTVRPKVGIGGFFFCYEAKCFQLLLVKNHFTITNDKNYVPKKSQSIFFGFCCVFTTALNLS